MFSRNELLWGKDFQKSLKGKHVAVFGVGAVGGYVAEMLARSGVGKLTIVDFDTVDTSNLNRQIIALHSNIGKKKVSEFKKRLEDINPELEVRAVDDFFTENSCAEIFSEPVDAVADAIDTVKSKIALLKYCHAHGIFAVSAVGAGNKLDPTKFVVREISQIEKPKNAFTANIIRILKKEGIEKGVVAVYSDEGVKPLEKRHSSETLTTKNGEEITFEKITPGSISYVTAVSGCLCAHAIIDYFKRLHEKNV